MTHIIKRMTIVAVSVIATCGPATQAVAQSFDCAKAATSVETLICETPLLSALDEEMAHVFNAARDAEGAGAVVDEQRSWLRMRTLCDSDVSCLEESYLHRIADLTTGSEPLRPGFYTGPFGELVLDVTASEIGGFRMEFSGGNANYTCGTDPAELRQAGNALSVSADGKPLLEVTRVGTGLLLPDTGTNRNLKAEWCGARAPDFLGSFFKYAPNEQ